MNPAPVFSKRIPPAVRPWLEIIADHCCRAKARGVAEPVARLAEFTRFARHPAGLPPLVGFLAVVALEDALAEHEASLPGSAATIRAWARDAGHPVLILVQGAGPIAGYRLPDPGPDFPLSSSASRRSMGLRSQAPASWSPT